MQLMYDDITCRLNPAMLQAGAELREVHQAGLGRDVAVLLKYRLYATQFLQKDMKRFRNNLGNFFRACKQKLKQVGKLDFDRFAEQTYSKRVTTLLEKRARV